MTCEEAKMLSHGKMGSFVRLMLFIGQHFLEQQYCFSTPAPIWLRMRQRILKFGGSRLTNKVLSAKTSGNVQYLPYQVR